MSFTDIWSGARPGLVILALIPFFSGTEKGRSVRRECGDGRIILPWTDMIRFRGDGTRFMDLWLNEPEKRRFDLWATYYGRRGDDPHRPHVDRYFRSHGGKFQNFNTVYLAHREEILAYEAVFVIDDDIEIGTEDINRLFVIRESYDLWILRRAFPPHSRISRRVTAMIPRVSNKYTVPGIIEPAAVRPA